MNAEQLHATCIEIKAEIESTGLISELEQLSKALQGVVNQPNQAEHQESVGQHREKIIASLDQIEESERPVLKQQIIEEIGGANILGGALRSRIEESFKQADVTPALVQQDVDKLREELNNFFGGLEQLIAGFERLSISADTLDDYVAELGVLIPKRDGNVDLESFSKDLRKLNTELQHFNELVTGNAGHLRVRALSSSDLSVFLEILPETAQVVVSTIALLLVGYEKLLDIRKKKAELEDGEAPQPLLDEMDRWAENLMTDKVNEITSELLEQFKDVERPDHRNNELEGHVRLSVKKIAGRIDAGYHFSARIGDVDERDEEDEGEEDETERAEIERQADVIKRIRVNASALEHRSIAGRPVLPLAWRPNDDGDEEDV